jgi:hypothetical protein
MHVNVSTPGQIEGMQINKTVCCSQGAQGEKPTLYVQAGIAYSNGHCAQQVPGAGMQLL